MKNPSQLLPFEAAGFKMQQVKWSDFKGEVDEQMPWSAHIYWWIEYQITDYKKKKIKVKLHISSRSWVRPEKKSAHLLNHEQGHYIIGGLCALEFLRRVEKKKNHSQINFEDLVYQTFDRTMKEYLQMQKKYDEETQHRLNYQKQDEWDCFLYDRISFYKQAYDNSQSKFVKINESSTKVKKNSSKRK